MIINNRLDKAFGPVGTTAGISLFIAGLIIFLNKFNDWFNTQDPDCQKLFQFI